MDINKLNTLRDQIQTLVKEYSEEKFKTKTFFPGVTPVPPSGKLIDFDEISLMVDSCLEGWLTSGEFNMQFEKKLAEFIGTKNLITVNSGSSANLVAFSTLTSPKLGKKAIKKGDEVLSVAAGFPTTINPIIQFGAIPVFIDIDLHTHNIDISNIESAITKKTKAIMIAHSLGNPFNLDAITNLCKKYNLWLIEDCCDALGSLYKNKMVGTFGDIATISFYPAHHITMGEGGAVFTNNNKLIDIAKSIRDWGRDCFCDSGKDNTCGKRFSWKLGDLPFGYDHKYTYSHLGYNLKITDMQAACGLGQLKKLNKFIVKRKENFKYLHSQLECCSDKIQLPIATKFSEPSWFGFPITLKKNSGIRRLDLINYLDQNKIGTRLLFAGNITKQPSMNDANYKIHGNLTNTDYVMENTFWIGLQPSLSKEMLNFVCNKIKLYLGLTFD